MKVAAFYLLLVLLAGCESRPAARTTTAVAASAALPDSVALAAAVAAARRFTADLSAARRAVLRQATLPADTSAPLVPKAAAPKLPRRPLSLPPHYTRNHRYVGTLGGQPVVLELTGELGDSYAAGSYYFEWGGQARSLAAWVTRQNQPLFLVESTIPYMPEPDEKKDAAHDTGTWRAMQRLGPVLTGTWTDCKTHRTAWFELHEEYTGAVQYEEVTFEKQAKRNCHIPSTQTEGSYLNYARYATWQGLRLLGPDASRLTWQQLQCPTPQQIRRELAVLLAQTNCDNGIFGKEQNRWVNYNSDGLLCWTDVTATITAANMPGQRVEEHTYDLATGQECRVADWLRPDKLREEQQLVMAYYTVQNQDEAALPKLLFWKGKLPTFLLASDGIAFRASGDDTSGQLFITFRQPITIPYAALAPCVRPGTPLARLVAARARPGR